ncbi:MAG: M23 family metallopeptidase, partial [Fusobacteriaceae bacterium]
IGDKAFIGIDKTGFTVKMIFDESDKVLVDQIKNLSDLNVTKHKMRISNPLANLFDFKSGIITNVFFNNTESANGIMVTIKFELSAYDYFSDNANTDSILDFSGKTITSNDSYMTNLYLESLCTDIMSALNSGKQDKLFMDSELSSPLDVTITNSRGVQGDVNKETTFDTVTKSYYSLMDFLGAYSSDITAMGGHASNANTISKASMSADYDWYGTKGSILKNFISGKELMELINSNRAWSFYNTINSGIRIIAGSQVEDSTAGNVARKDLNGGFFYRYVDMVSMSSLYKSKQGKDAIKVKPYQKESFDELGGNYGSEYEGFDQYFNTNDGYISKKVVEYTVNEMFNNKVQNLEIRSLIYYRSVYRNILFDLFDNTERMGSIKVLKETESFITSKGINFVAIKEMIKSITLEHLNNAIKMINNSSFKSDMVNIIFSELVDGMNQKTHGHTKKSINDFVDLITDEMLKEFKKCFGNVEKSIDRAMGYFMTKLAYSSIFLIGQSDRSIIGNLIKSHIASAGFMGFFGMKTNYRTDSFGYAYDSSSKVISKCLNSFFFVYKKRFNKLLDGRYVERTDKEVLDGYFSEKLKYSNYIDKVKLNFFEMERNVINEQNKDYNYFYGNKINNDGISMFLNDVFIETCDIRGLNANVEKFVLTKYAEFSKGDKFCESIDNLVYNYEAGQSRFPISRYQEVVHKDGKITDLMKKRIIGESSVFSDLIKINKIVNNPVYDVMPDYEVLIKKRDLEEFGAVGFRNDFSISSAFVLKNLIKVDIALDPKTKIKTASISSFDVGKRIVDKTKNGSISVQVATERRVDSIKVEGDNSTLIETKDKETIELFSIEAGDLIEIRLGSFRNKELDIEEGQYNSDYRKSVVFRGTISTIDEGNGLIKMDCVSCASVLYSIKNKNVVFGKEKITSKFTNFVTTVLSYFGNADDKKVKISELNDFKEYKSCNNHLFKPFSDIDMNKLMVEGEEASMFNVAHFALGSLPTVYTNLITGSNSPNLGLASRKMVISQMSSAFGIMSEIDDPRSRAINPNIYRNIFNVDKDYDTYGINYVYTIKGNEKLLTSYETKTNDSYTVDQEYVSKKEPATETGSESTPTVDQNVPAGTPVEEKGFAWPTESRRVTSRYQLNRVHPETKKKKDHLAIDIGRKTNSKGQFINAVNYIRASRGGVCTVRWNKGGYGHYVTIVHDYEKNGKKIPCSTLYAHLDSVNVKSNQRVNAGDVIGVMGATGGSVGIHLHFEIALNNVKMDPQIYLKGGIKA